MHNGGANAVEYSSRFIFRDNIVIFSFFCHFTYISERSTTFCDQNSHWELKIWHATGIELNSQ